MATKTQELAQFLEAHIILTGKTQREIAREAKIPSINFISMMKAGNAKVPLRRVPALAAALEVPAIDLLWRCLAAYEPEVVKILEAVIPEGPMSESEIMLVRAHRFLVGRGIIDDEGCELRGLGSKGRVSGWARLSRGPADWVDDDEFEVRDDDVDHV
jgi:transcriptional regulator with XRE-family HTH domain